MIIKTLFSNNKKVLLDRKTGELILSNNTLEPKEAFFTYDQIIPSSKWFINHNMTNDNYIINLFVKNSDGTHSRVIAYKTYNIDNSTIIIDFSGIETTGYATILFLENDIEAQYVDPTPTPTTTGTVTPTPTQTPTITPTLTPTMTVTRSNHLTDIEIPSS